MFKVGHLYKNVREQVVKKAGVIFLIFLVSGLFFYSNLCPMQKEGQELFAKDIQNMQDLPNVQKNIDNLQHGQELCEMLLDSKKERKIIHKSRLFWGLAHGCFLVGLPLLSLLVYYFPE